MGLRGSVDSLSLNDQDALLAQIKGQASIYLNFYYTPWGRRGRKRKEKKDGSAAQGDALGGAPA